ncbi:TRAP-type transport system permease protein [Natronolimnohabitans innermongolicus JCM 12255]|uniref:TRAP-type transport system permease protein n=2 Tax=Natronolimnohabitans innermongolicus TaxID=253107 RepID=L9XAM3_9EURY|nr:TRAP-type transport system permease protein [Natronolimnohabitans innermongolicus JCM 12255]
MTMPAVLTALIYVFGVTLTAFTVYYAYALPFTEPVQYVNIFLGIGLALYYLMEARDALESDPLSGGRLGSALPSSPRLESGLPYLLSTIAIVFAVASLVATGYVHVNFDRLDGALSNTTLDIVMGILIIFLVTDATRRAFGYIFTSVVVLSLVYAFAGPLLPGLLNHGGWSIERIAREGAIGIQGTYGFILDVGSTWVAIFIMFAGIAKVYGALDFVLNVGSELGKSLRSGVVQIAVVASMIMGSITGSAAANTATTGSFTIPMIKEQGIRDDFAAAIEAVASSGGQMLPPVMGVAAFLMADILGVSYLSIVQAGVIPAALFYVSVGVAIYLIVLKFGWTTDERESFEYLSLLKGVHFLIPLGVLLYTLIVLRYTPLAAGLYTIATIVAVMYVRNALVDVFDADTRAQAALDDELERRSTDRESGIVARTRVGTTTLAAVLGRGARATVSGVSGTLSDLGSMRRIAVETVFSILRSTKQTLDGFKQGAVEMAPLVGILASLGVVLQMVDGTGFAGRLSQEMVALSGGVLIVLLLMAMIASILFGLGMPTPAAYLLVAMLIVPSVIAMDVQPITAHMFVFYFAMLSAITPPVAVSVAIGSNIAGASFPRASVQALRIGAPGFVIPFAFIANDSLIYWSFPETLLAFPLVLAGTIALVVSTIGFDGAHSLSLPARGLYLVAAFAAMFGATTLTPLLTVTPLLDLAVQLAGGLLIAGALGYANVVVGYDPETSGPTEPSYEVD